MRKLLCTAALIITAATCQAGNVQDLINNLKGSIAPDKRVAVWDVTVTEDGAVPVVSGAVGYQEQADAIAAMLQENNITFENKLRVLADEIPADRQWALVKLSIATLRCTPEHSGEIATQGIMGMPVRILEQDDDWCRVQCPDNYIAYVPESSLTFMPHNGLKAWNNDMRMIVTVYDDRLVTEPGGDETVSDLVMGNILKLEAVHDGWTQLSTPDGRKGWTRSENLAFFDTWEKQAFDLNQIEKTARRMMGSSYLWGGTSTKVTDCSGLVKVSYFSNAVILQRDASQQALTGEKIADWHNARLGDLLFFGNSKTGRVTHVGIYLRDGKYIHCSGQVKINDLNPDAPDYLYSPLSISRIDGQLGTRGIVQVKNHPWYNEK